MYIILNPTVIPSSHGHIVDEDVVIVLSFHYFGSAVKEFSGLIQHHVTGLHYHIVLISVMIKYQEWPVFLHAALVDVDDGGHYVRIDSVDVHSQY